MPSSAVGLPVQLAINGGTYPLWDRFGNIVLGLDMIQCKGNRCYYGEDNDAHVLCQTLPVLSC